MRESVPFCKYHGTGNDFILIDNRDLKVKDIRKDWIAGLCHRRFGIGADGLILLQEKKGFDFEMIYYNADGNESSMCGNGGRCIVSFAAKLGLIHDKAAFYAVDGPHEAVLKDFDPDFSCATVSLRMSDVLAVEQINNHFFVDTGSPHYVQFVNDLANLNVVLEGRRVRNSERFLKDGTNVNFVMKAGPGMAGIRTYERGVEDETWSCGTGVTAAALVLGFMDPTRNQFQLKTPGGNLSVSFEREGKGYTRIFLEGPAVFVYNGIIPETDLT